jgi:hypothetical protein
VTGTLIRLPASPNRGSSENTSWSSVTEEMFGGQHRNDELTRIERVGWTRMKIIDGDGESSAQKERSCADRWGVLEGSKIQNERLLTGPTSLERIAQPS